MATSTITNNAVIEDISDKFTFSSAWTNYGRVAWRVGKMVYFYLNGYAGTITGGTQYTMATIASGYRPASTISFTWHTINNGYVPQSIVDGHVRTSGDIDVRASNGNGNFVIATGFYLMA